MTRIKRVPLAKNTALRARQAEAARNADVATLVQSVDGTVWEIVRRYGRGLSEVDLEDLHAAGKVGAVEAAMKYDLSDNRGAAFNTYAKKWIISRVLLQVIFFWGRGRFRGTQAPAMKMFSRYSRAVRYLEALGEAATPERLAAIIGVSVGELTGVVAVVSAQDKPIDEPSRGGLTVEDVVPDAETPDLLGELCRRTGQDEVQAAISDLGDRERFVIWRRFYFEETQSAVGEALGVSQGRVGQIEERAVAKLRKKLSKMFDDE